MLSPHTSYPVLEMAASGGLVVTNSFATKSAERLGRISPNIIAARPAADSIAAALIDAAGRVSRGYDRLAPLALPDSWDASLGNVVGDVADWITRVPAAR